MAKKTFKFKFAGINGFRLFAKFIEYALNDMAENVANILQLRLLRHIIGNLYQNKIIPKTIYRQDKYQIALDDAQAVAVALALHNHRPSLELEEDLILTGILMDLMKFLERVEPAQYPALPESSP